MNRHIRRSAVLLTALLMTASMAACSVDPMPTESGVASPEPGSAASTEEGGSSMNSSTDPISSNTTTAPPGSDTGSKPTNPPTSSGSAVPSLSAEDAAKRINNVDGYGVNKVATDIGNVYTPAVGWGYAHHPHIAHFKGTFYATFSQGRENEDDCGQRIMLSTSKDGLSWSTPEPLIDSVQGKESELVLVNAGVYTDGNRLIVYYGSYEYRADTLRGPNLRPLEDAHRIDYAMHLVSTTDGSTWSAPQKMTIPFGCNFGPLPLQSGRLLMCGGTTYPYTDDPTGLSGFITGKIDGAEAVSRGAKIINEGSFFQTDDGVIYMMLRTNTKFLWCSRSEDNGATWSKAYQTNFTDCSTKFQFGRLPDGRFFYVGSPIPGSDRNPLMLCLSEDGQNFNRQFILRSEAYKQQIPGLYKGGVYGYPSTVIADGYMYVIYSKHKEAIEVTRVALSMLP